jgi:hypothetical protein
MERPLVDRLFDVVFPPAEEFSLVNLCLTARVKMDLLMKIRMEESRTGDGFPCFLWDRTERETFGTPVGKIRVKKIVYSRCKGCPSARKRVYQTCPIETACLQPRHLVTTRVAKSESEILERKAARRKYEKLARKNAKKRRALIEHVERGKHGTVQW